MTGVACEFPVQRKDSVFKLSTRGRYGLRAAVQLAETYETNQSVRLADLSAMQNISIKYLAATLILLRNGGIVRSTRGSRGGYRLARHPSKTNIYEILVLLEGPLILVDCLSPDGNCEREIGCPTQGLWQELTDLFTRTLESVTLEQLIKCHHRKGSSILSID